MTLREFLKPEIENYVSICDNSGYELLKYCKSPAKIENIMSQKILDSKITWIGVDDDNIVVNLDYEEEDKNDD